MTDKQRVFAEHYAQSGNATQAAIAAGYSPRSAYSQGSRMLKNDEVAAFLRQLQADLAAKRTADAQEVRETLTAFLRDGKQKTCDRLRAADQLLRSGGEYLTRRPAACPDADVMSSADGDGGGVQIVLPWTGRPSEPFNAYETMSGEIVPCTGTDPTADLLIFISMDQAKTLEKMHYYEDDAELMD